MFTNISKYIKNPILVKGRGYNSRIPPITSVRFFLYSASFFLIAKHIEVIRPSFNGEEPARSTGKLVRLAAQE